MELGLAVGEAVAVIKESILVGGIVGLEITWLGFVQALKNSMTKTHHVKEDFPIKFLSASESAFFIAYKPD